MTVALRPLEEADLRRIYDWQRQPGLYDHLVGACREVSWEEAWDWMTRHWLPQGPDHRYALCAGGEVVGCVYLLSLDDAPGTLEFHIFIGDENRRARGVGRQALAEALRLAFEELGAEVVHLEVLETNSPARRLYWAAGFTETGRREVAKRLGTVPAISMTLSRAAYRAR